MNTEQEKQLAIKGAEHLGYKILSTDFSECVQVIVPNYGSCLFDPANNANDRDKLIEKLKVDVFYNDVWSAAIDKGIDTTYFTNKDRDKAILKCLCAVLGVE